MPGGTCKVEAGQPHLARNAGEISATFLVLQGIGEYEDLPLPDSQKSLLSPPPKDFQKWACSHLDHAV